jgi:hypothetical protein
MELKRDMHTFRSLSILLPTLNETFSFTRTVDIILSECALSDIRELIVIVCDRTLLKSLAAIEASKAKCEASGILLRIIRQELPHAGGAVRDGISAAEGSHILMMSSDLETDPRLVSEFIRRAKLCPGDMITASRWLKKNSFTGYSRVKMICNFIFQKAFSFIYGAKLTDMTFGYRCAPAQLFQAIAWEETGHPFFLETVLKPLRLGVRVHEIPAEWKAREEGESQNSFWATFKYFKIAFKVRFEHRAEILRSERECV